MKTQKILSIGFTTVTGIAMVGLFVFQVMVKIDPEGPQHFVPNPTRLAYGYAGCGDGSLAPASPYNEVCDDGNTTAGDGCSASCSVESGWSCTSTPAATSVCTSVCGNGIKTGNEGCDDSNTTAGDGCSATCSVESGYSCTGSTPSSCSIVCGNSIVTSPETCDDGGDSATCDDDCTAATCGDSNENTTAGEECDDGNSVNTDACTNTCHDARCGDGIIQSGEACEPSLDSTCSTSCTVQTGVGGTSGGTGESTYTPVVFQSEEETVTRRAPPPNCGNGVIDLEDDEQCDNARYNGVSPGCDRWCQATYCGDGVVQTSNREECEPAQDIDGSFIVQQCGMACTAPTCVNGKCTGGCTVLVQNACKANETPPVVVVQDVPTPPTAAPTTDVMDVISKSIDSIMDVTNIIDNLRIEPPGPVVDTSPVEQPDGFSVLTCGNGVVEFSEQCDDGSLNSNTDADTCRTSCARPFCGDSVTDTGEQCDDGNAILGDGCTPTCMRSTCGNTVLELGEECDNGDMNSDAMPDSCSMLCLMPRCGDNITDPSFGEECDDGTQNADFLPDHCRRNCVISRCGDSVTDSGEECDDGNTSNVDRCTSSCAMPRCGDGFVQKGEQCDDANMAMGDGCNTRCKLEGAPLHSAAEDLESDPTQRTILWLLIILLFTTTAYLVEKRRQTALRRR